MEYTKKDGSVISDEWMDAIANAAETDTLRGSVIATQTGSGRPRLYEDDELETISFRLPKSRILAIDTTIKSKGESRSEFLRNAVDKALATN
jgi:hypothetical protein